MGKIIPVLLSGGNGNRLWPLSRQACPKQFLPFTRDETLLQQTAKRVHDRSFFDDLIVIADANHRFAVAEQLQAVGASVARIVLEPVGRNTAPAAAVAAILAVQKDPRAVILLMPADHCIYNLEAFHKDLKIGMHAARSGSFVLFGIAPTAPATGYGYIRLGENGNTVGARRVERFVEKPDLMTAQRYLADEDYVWNSGIFLLPAQPFLDELKRLEPELTQCCEDAVLHARADADFLRLDTGAFAKARDISIDYAVMEKTENAVVVPASFEWSDIGTWASLWNMAHKSEDGTVMQGEVLARDTKGCYIRSDGPLVAALGVEDLIIVATQDAVLVTKRNRDQDVKHLVEELRASDHRAATQACSCSLSLKPLLGDP